MRLYRDFGLGTDEAGACQNLIASAAFDWELEHGSYARVSNVTMSGSELRFFTVHVAIINYPRVHVSNCSFEDGTVGGVDGYGLRVGTPPTEKLHLRKGTLEGARELAMLVGSPQLPGFADSAKFVVLANVSFVGLVNPPLQATRQHGGAAFLAGFEYGEVTDVHVDGTRVGGDGGGMYFSNVARVLIRRSVFENVHFLATESAGGAVRI